MKTVQIQVFEFQELSKKAQERAINEMIEFILEAASDSNMVKKAVAEAERLHTPWFIGAILWENNQEYIQRVYLDDSMYRDNGEFYAWKHDIQEDDSITFFINLDQDEQLVVLESAYWAMDHFQSALDEHLDYETKGIRAQ